MLLSILEARIMFANTLCLAIITVITFQDPLKNQTCLPSARRQKASSLLWYLGFLSQSFFPPSTLKYMLLYFTSSPHTQILYL
jgi:hypothetical protein